MPFLRSRFVDQGSDYHFSHDFPAFSPLIVGAQSKCHFCGPVSFGKAQTFVFFLWISCIFAFIRRPILGAISAVPSLSSRLGLSFFPWIFLHFRSHTEAHPRCHFCGPVSLIKAPTTIFHMIFLHFRLS